MLQDWKDEGREGQWAGKSGLGLGAGKDEGVHNKQIVKPRNGF